MANKDNSEEISDLIHKLNHHLTLVYSYIDISIQYLNNETTPKEDIIQFLSEAQNTYDDVKNIIGKISDQVGKVIRANED